MSENSPESDDKAHADVGIVCALPIEMGQFIERCTRVKKYTGGKFVFRGGFYDSVRVAVVECGMGFSRARQATQSLIEAHTPSWVLSCGFSGALIDGMKPGNIVLANSIIDTHGHELQVDARMQEDRARGLFLGRTVTTDELVRTVEEKRALAETHDAIAVDMESLAVAQVCGESGIRFLSIRVISDDLSADLPPEVLSVVASTGTMRLGAALGSVWKRPGSVKDMWRLRETARDAAGKLATFLDGVLTQLYEAGRPESGSRKAE